RASNSGSATASSRRVGGGPGVARERHTLFRCASGIRQSPRGSAMTYSLLDGRLTLTRDFQEGASGTRLWHGTHVQWGEVVIKTIRRPHDPADRSKRQGYFRDEVECGQIESPYVRRLLESGEIDSASELGYPNGIFYLVFERMQSSLEDVLRENTPALDEVRDLV